MPNDFTILAENYNGPASTQDQTALFTRYDAKVRRSMDAIGNMVKLFE